MCSLANSEDPDKMPCLCGISLGYTLFAMTKTISGPILSWRNDFYGHSPPSADSFKKGCWQLQAKVCAEITG